ncbi:10236_t:CDS:1, partial [Racocetra persica]
LHVYMRLEASWTFWRLRYKFIVSTNANESSNWIRIRQKALP